MYLFLIFHIIKTQLQLGQKIIDHRKKTQNEVYSYQRLFFRYKFNSKNKFR